VFSTPWREQSLPPRPRWCPYGVHQIAERPLSGAR
jgi:hypothetical protein